MRLAAVCLWPCLATIVLVPTVGRADESPSNVVLIVIDDLGSRDLGCYGSKYYRTPNIDSLAADGVRFTDAYSACHVCSPTRAAIMTGKYPARLLLTQWLPDGRWSRTKNRMQPGRYLGNLPLEEVTIAESLREAGYHTAFMGKWHLGTETYYFPEHQGFDLNVAGRDYGAPGSYFYPFEGKWKIPTTDKLLQKESPLSGKPGDYLTDRLTDEAEKFIRSQDNQNHPFFLVLSHYAVHSPLQGKPEKVAHYEAVPRAEQQGKPAYAAMIESVDESVGRVLNALKEIGQTERTLVIFASDNGATVQSTDNAPLRAGKGSSYEGGVRTPLIISYPGRFQPAVSDTPVISTDLYPTILAASGLPLRPHQHVDGESLLPILTGTAPLERKALFWHYPHYNQHEESFPAGVIRAGDWKLIENYETGELSLYNLARDESEATNLADSEPDRTASLHGQLKAWRTEVGADPMRPNPEYVVPVAHRATAPRRVRHTASSPAHLRVEWDDVATNETGYRIWRREVNGPWYLAGEVAADAMHFDDGGMQALTVYEHKVAAFNNLGEGPAATTDRATSTLPMEPHLHSEVIVPRGETFPAAPAVVSLKSGELLLAYHTNGVANRKDHRGKSTWLAASRENRTAWTDPRLVLHGDPHSVGKAALVRMPDDRLGLAFSRWTCNAMGKIVGRDRYFIASADEGMTWNKPVEVGPHSANNQTLIVGDRKRLLEPLSSTTDLSEIYASDDLGRSWRLLGEVPGRLLGEAALAHLGDGRLVFLSRHEEPFYHLGFSADNGATWEQEKTTLYLGGGDNPPKLVLLPDGRTVAAIVHSWYPGEKSKDLRQLASVISRDGGRTWDNFRLIGFAPDGDDGFLQHCVTFVGEIAYLFYGGGSSRDTGAGEDLRLLRLHQDFFTSTTPWPYDWQGKPLRRLNK